MEHWKCNGISTALLCRNKNLDLASRYLGGASALGSEFGLLEYSGIGFGLVKIWESLKKRSLFSKQDFELELIGSWIQISQNSGESSRVVFEIGLKVTKNSLYFQS